MIEECLFCGWSPYRGGHYIEVLCMHLLCRVVGSELCRGWLYRGVVEVAIVDLK